jgi:hypothetical protein
MSLKLLDTFLTMLHLIIIGFNLLGWIWPAMRRLHLIVVSATAGCWLILGIWFGLGYCPITDWQWHVKEQLGEHNLPGSFIKYFIDKITGKSVNASLVDACTAIGFLMAVMVTIYVNFVSKQKTKR